MLAFTKDKDYFALSLLVYNFCAFVLQMPIGALADRFGRTGGFAVTGCVFIALSMLAEPAPLVFSALLGFGNACYHVGGGTFALRAGRRCTGLGAFVSTGALGLAAGRLAVMKGYGGVYIAAGTAVIMLAVAAAVIISEPVADTYETVAPFPKGLTVSYPHRNILACAAFFIVVCLRSFGGLAFNFEWKGTADAVTVIIVAAAASALGKAAGGVMSDAVGMRTTSSVTLILCGVVMLFSGHMIPAAVGIFLFNMTMPLTLRATADICGGHEGFSFGLLTAALFAGYLPVSYGISLPFGVYGNAAVAFVSMALMAAGLELTNKRTKPV